MKIKGNKKVFFLLSLIMSIFLTIICHLMASDGIDEINQSTQSSSRNEARKHYNRGADFLDLKKYEECIKESEIAVKLDPKLDGAYCNLGGAYFMKGDYNKALLYLNKAFEINPNRKATRDNLSLVYVKLGSLYVEDKKYDEALKIYLDLVKLKPNDANARAQLGFVHIFMGSNEVALQEYQKALELEPSNYMLHYMVGRIYVKLKLYDKAIDAFREGIKFNPNNADLHYELGVTYYDKGLIQEAIDETKQVIKINPEHEGAKRNLKILEAIKDTPFGLKTDTLQGELNKFLLSRKPTLEDTFSSQVVFINIGETGYFLPVSAALAFIDHLCFNNRYKDVIAFCE